MATIQEIKKALKSDPGLLERIPGLKEFVDQNRDQFDFLFKNETKKPNSNGRIYSESTGSNGNSGGSNGNSGGTPDNVKDREDKEAKKWNPKITQI